MKKLLIVLAIMLIPTATSALTLATEDHWECGNIEEGLYFFTLEHSMMDARMPYYLCCCGEKMDHQAMLLNYHIIFAAAVRKWIIKLCCSTTCIKLALW